jgi:diguanylate cyclase
LLHALRDVLPADSPSAPALADELGALADRLARDGAQPALVQAIARACERARWLVGHRQDLLAAVGGLCRELGEGLVELAEDESWARGQCQALQARLDGGLNPRSIGSATALLAETRRRQRTLRSERQAANQALKALIRSLLEELAALGAQTERFEARVDLHARAIAQADSLQGLGGVVGELLQDTRTAQDLVRRTRERLQQDESRAGALEQRVRELEGELRRLSDEVATDGLTRVANRRGLERAFAAVAARAAQAPADAAALAVGLIDIDNFKRLNDTLGHQAGDEALKALAAGVRARLREGDTVARFGGEEFVLLLPGTGVADGQQRLTQLQRSLSASLFLHEGREVFVTFSAGVTAWRPGEPLDAALQRADEALYQAKRTGKNRTCVA